MSEGGICLRSTAKNGTVSTITPMLAPGSVVTMTRNDLDYVVTEHGLAHLRGRSVHDRAEQLIRTAHPQFREMLREEAEKHGWLPRRVMISADHWGGEVMPTLDLKGLLDGLRVGDVHLLGVSNGAVVALQFAVNWPERVKGLVLANGYGRADTALQVKLSSWLAGMAAGGGPLRFDVATPWVWGATFLNRHFEVLKPFRENAGTLPGARRAAPDRGAMRFDVLEQAANITCPTLAMAGDEDVLTPLSYSHALQGQIAGSRVAMMTEAAGAGEQGPWRVSVRHVQSGEEVRFTRLSDAMAFIEECARQDAAGDGPCSEVRW